MPETVEQRNLNEGTVCAGGWGLPKAKDHFEPLKGGGEKGGGLLYAEGDFP